MTAVERLGGYAAECDLAAANAETPHERAVFERMAADWREFQMICADAEQAREGWFTRLREWCGGAK